MTVITCLLSVCALVVGHGEHWTVVLGKLDDGSLRQTVPTSIIPTTRSRTYRVHSKGLSFVVSFTRLGYCLAIAPTRENWHKNDNSIILGLKAGWQMWLALVAMKNPLKDKRRETMVQNESLIAFIEEGKESTEKKRRRECKVKCNAMAVIESFAR